MAAVWISSPDTVGPTDSTDGKVTSGSMARNASCTAPMVSLVTLSSPSWAWIDTVLTFWSAANVGSKTWVIVTSPNSSGSSAAR